MKRPAILFLMGALYASVGDFLHMIRGITIYPAPVALRQPNGTPLWTLFLFGFAGMTIGYSFVWFRGVCRSLGKVQFRAKTNVRHAFAGGLFFLALYALSAFIGKLPSPIPDVVLAILTIIFWRVFDGNLGSLLFGFSVGVFGMATEQTLVNLDFFLYGDHLFKILGVASWVPWIYVTAGVAVADTMVLMERSPPAGPRGDLAKNY